MVQDFCHQQYRFTFWGGKKDLVEDSQVTLAGATMNISGKKMVNIFIHAFFRDEVFSMHSISH